MLHCYKGDSTRIGGHLSQGFISPQSWETDITNTPFFDDGSGSKDSYEKAWDFPDSAHFYAQGDISAESFAPIIQKILRPHEKSDKFITFGFAYFDEAPCALMMTYLKEDLSVWAVVKVKKTNALPINREIEVLSSVDFSADKRFTKQPEEIFFKDKCKDFVANLLKNNHFNPDGPSFFRLLASQQPIKKQFIDKVKALSREVEDLEPELQGSEVFKKLQTQLQCLYLLLEAQELLVISMHHIEACTNDPFFLSVLPLLQQVTNPAFRNKMVAALFQTEPSSFALSLPQRLEPLIGLLNLLNEQDLEALSSIIAQLYLPDEGFDDTLPRISEFKDSAVVSSFLKDYFNPSSLLKKILAGCNTQSKSQLIGMIVFLHKQNLLPLLEESKIPTFADYYRLIQNDKEDFKQWCYFFWIKFQTLDFPSYHFLMKEAMDECPLLAQTLLKNHLLGLQNAKDIKAWIGTKEENYRFVIQNYFLQNDVCLETFKERELVQACSSLELLEFFGLNNKEFCAKILRADATGLLLRCILSALKGEKERVTSALLKAILHAPDFHYSKLQKQLSELADVDMALKDLVFAHVTCIARMQRWLSEDILSQLDSHKAVIFIAVDKKIRDFFKEKPLLAQKDFCINFYSVVNDILNGKKTIDDLKKMEEQMLLELGKPQRSKVKQFFVDLINLIATIVTLGFIGSYQEKKTGQRKLWGRTQTGVNIFKLFKEVKATLSEENQDSFQAQPPNP